MTRAHTFSFWTFGAVALCLVAMFAYTHNAHATAPIEVRWLIAHQPSAVFQRAEKLLASELTKDSGEAYHVTFLTPEDMGLQSPVSAEAIAALLHDGKIDLVSMNVDSIIAMQESQGVHSDDEVLHLPYLFNDYASADKVLDGPVGKDLLGLIQQGMSGQALAFTYSGGFRVIASNKGPLTTVQDLKGLRINTWGSKTMQDSLASLGMIPVPVDIIGGGKDLIESGKSDGVELTYTRADEAIGDNVKSVFETNHVLFLSALFASDSFYSSLSPQSKQILGTAAQLAAQTERQDSIAYNNDVRASLIQKGVTVTAPTAKERASLEAWGSDFRSKYDLTASMKDLEDRILEAQ